VRVALETLRRKLEPAAHLSGGLQRRRLAANVRNVLDPHRSRVERIAAGMRMGST